MNRKTLMDIAISDLEDYGVDLSIINSLENEGIHWFKQLLFKKPKELEKINNLGRPSVIKLIGAVKEHKKRNGW